MYKVTNIANGKRGFEAEGKLHELEAKESILMRKPPRAVEGILTVSTVDEKASKKPEEKTKITKEEDRK